MFEMPKAKILNLANLAQYQGNAVANSHVLRAKNGNVTLFAFDEAQELSENSTPFDALLQVLDGEAEIIISGESFSMQAGETIILPADKPYAVKATKQFKMLLMMIRAQQNIPVLERKTNIVSLQSKEGFEKSILRLQTLHSFNPPLRYSAYHKAFF